MYGYKNKCKMAAESSIEAVSRQSEKEDAIVVPPVKYELLKSTFLCWITSLEISMMNQITPWLQEKVETKADELLIDLLLRKESRFRVCVTIIKSADPGRAKLAFGGQTAKWAAAHKGFLRDEVQASPPG